MKFKKHIARANAVTTSLTVAQVAKVLNLPTGLDLSGHMAAVLELGGFIAFKDVYAWCDANKFTRPILSSICIDGATEQSDPGGSDGEVSLDVCVIAGLAQGCQIVIVFAPNTEQGFLDGFQKCVDLNPDSISISWGSEEASYSEAALNALNAVAVAGKAKLTNTFAASGDSASSDGGSGNNVDSPASCPDVIGCGGTMLTLNADGTRYSEVAWSLASDGSGSGGGISSVFPVPEYQKSLGLSMRAVPDLAANGSPNSAWKVEVDGTDESIAGTSAVAPAMAATCIVANAVMGKRVLWQDLIYANPEIFYDITQGTNGGYSCKVGFDEVTGLGTIDCARFIQAAKGEPITPWPVRVDPTPAPVVSPTSNGLFTQLINFLKSIF